MLALNLTALMVYWVFKAFALSGMAVTSLATLVAGVAPPSSKRPRLDWLVLHYEVYELVIRGVAGGDSRRGGRENALYPRLQVGFGVATFVSSATVIAVGA
ncbi:MAG: hypothetical protein NZ585_04920 [Chloracidobacterium sp.]|nr:hypothetical protein [Chloracidobacterium sp.]MDW8216826.1 hypothetical protein [Acidobacteriota bacterium]